MILHSRIKKKLGKDLNIRNIYSFLMAYENDLTNYSKAIKTNKIKKNDFKLAISERKQVLVNQGKRCANCKKALDPIYTKYIRDYKTNTLKALCSNCAISTVKRN